MQQYKTQIKKIKSLTEHTVELTVSLVSPTDITFVAGQYMEIVVEGKVKACTIIDEPGHNQILRFCVGLYNEGLFSDFLRFAQEGQVIDMQGPMGDFTVTDLSKDYFFIATSVGIAPFVSIVADMFKNNYYGKVNLLFGLRHEEDIFYFDKFRHLQALHKNFVFTPLLSRPKSHWPGETGHVTTYIDISYDRFADRTFYVCGTDPMATDVKNLLLKKGHSPDKMRVEIF